MYFSERIRMARERRGLTQKALADATGLTSKTINNYENANNFELAIDDNISKIANALNYPLSFFEVEDTPTLENDNVSFRAMTKLSAGRRASAISAGKLAQDISKWIESSFRLPEPCLPDCSFDNFMGPDQAARVTREVWGLGELSLKNIIHLVESKGVRVFSLAENCLEVDAFSFWMDNKPFMLLNTMKTPERSRFDTAHELGHLIMHKHSSNSGREAEIEADRFASAFLMPERSVLANIPRMPSLDLLIELKKFWNVSLAALVRRTFDLNLSTEWHYRQLCIDLTRRGFKTSEPEGLEVREKSLILDKIFTALRQQGIKRSEVLEQLNIPLDEMNALTFNNPFFMEAYNGISESNDYRSAKAKLSLVK